MNKSKIHHTISSMVVQLLFAGFLLATTYPLAAQSLSKDTLDIFLEDTVFAFMQKNNTGLLLTSQNTDKAIAGKRSFLPLMNTIAGVRMEERSLGSYRLNIRGSSVRSPFGVRNIKVYWNNIPLTDPGGNTYFNQLAFNNFSTMEIVKSPASSMYGAGTGGVVFANNYISNNEASVEYIAGTYHSHTILASGSFKNKGMSAKITYAHNESDGFRQQSAIKLDNVSWTSNFYLPGKQQLLLSILYTDMYYQTPGALTLSEFESNEKSARPATGIFPSAVEAKAAIFQRNFTGGIFYRNKISSILSNSTMVYASYNKVENSAIRNYERRKEPHMGGRTVFSINKKWANGNRLDCYAGADLQLGNFQIKVNSNKKGIPDTLQSNDDVNAMTYSVFTQLVFSTSQRWTYTTSVSCNKSKTGVRRLNDNPMQKQPFSFISEIAPRFTISKLATNRMLISGTVAKGFSPPTIAELLPSTGIVNDSLLAEKGWNYEISCRYQPVAKLYFNVAFFHFGLREAIVQRRDIAGADYFTNAGKTNQNGLELSGNYIYVPKYATLIKQGTLDVAYTYSHFKYQSFLKGTDNFSSNTIPGIPQKAISIVAGIDFRNEMYLSSTYYGASAVFLDDANTTMARPYHLLGLKLGYKIPFNRFFLNLYTGVDNLLNEKYSLGNDINAANGRYYNAAPRRNYYAGAAISFAIK